MGKGKSQIKSGVILNYVNILVGSLVPMLYTPIMLRLLGQSEYGLYKLSTTFTSYLALVAFGIGSAVNRYLIKADQEKGKAEEERYFGLFLTIYRVIAIISFVVGMVFMLTVKIWYGKSLSPEEIKTMKTIVFILVCNVSINFIVTPYISIITAHQKYIFQQSMNITSTIALPIANLIALMIGYRSVGMAVSSLIMNLILRFAYLFYVKKSLRIKPNYKNMPTDKLKEILTFSFWVFVAQIVDMLYNSTDTVLIGAVPALATIGVAVYNIGATFSSLGCNLASSMTTVFTPETHKRVFSGATMEELSQYATKIGRIQAYIMSLVVSGFAVFGQPFIQFYAGDGYEEAYKVALLILVPMMIPMVQSVCMSILYAKNMHKFRSLVYLVIAIVNVFGTWFAMKKWGISGAAAVTGIALIIGQGFVMNWYYKKKVGLDVKSFWKQILKIYIVPLVMGILGLYISKYIDFYNIINMILGIVVYTIVFAIINWLLVMNDYEKNLVRKPIKKVLGKIKK